MTALLVWAWVCAIAAGVAPWSSSLRRAWFRLADAFGHPSGAWARTRSHRRNRFI